MSELLTMTDAEYRLLPERSQSQIKRFIDDPELFHDEEVNGRKKKKESKQIEFGNLVDALVLEGRRVVEVPPDVLASNGSRRGGKWDAFKEENKDAILATGPQLTEARKAVEQLSNHAMASRLLWGEGGSNYAVARWDAYEGMMFKSQFDRVYLDQDLIVDLKTCESVDPEKFAYKTLDFGYHIQADFYCHAYHSIFERWPRFVFVCVKNTPAYSVECFELSEFYRELGMEAWTQGIVDLSEALDRDEWRTPTSEMGEIIKIAPPPKATRPSMYTLE